MAATNPITIRDFSLGRYTKDVVSPALIPQNSVSNSINVNYDEIIGSGKVRPGTTRLGGIVAAGQKALGLAQFVPKEGENLGPELVTNGTFTGSAAGWTLGDGWSYGTNNVLFTYLGSELITNGSFTGSATGWTLTGGWTYGTNNVNSTGANGSLSQTLSLVNGSTYQVVFTTSGVTGTKSLTATITGSFVSPVYNVSNGTETNTQIATASSTEITFIPYSAGGSTPFAGNLDDVSVKLAGVGALSQDVGLLSGQTYSITLSTGGTTGSVTIQLGSTGDSFMVPAGSSSIPFTGIANGDSIIYITATSDFDGTVDDVSVKQQFNRLLLAVFNGNPTATLYYFDGAVWNASDLDFLTDYVKCRFSTLGGSEFFTNQTEGMYTSTDGATWMNGAPNNCIVGVFPSLVYRYAQRMLAAGDPTLPDRIYFSSIIDPTASPFITWDTDPVTGDWIDVNPDDGGNITGFSESSTFLLIFKDTGMYRMDVVDKTVNPDNIFDVGAVNQECIVLCQGVTYFFSGQDIRRTNGGYPEQISRTGVQDIIDSMTPADWQNVAGGTDGLNVWWSLGSITLNHDQSEQTTIQDCVIKFSTRDQTWSVHSYNNFFKFFAQYTNADGPLLRASDDDGDVQTIDLGTTDDGEPIYFFLETQEIEFGNRATLKEISDNFAVFTRFGAGSVVSGKTDTGSFETLPVVIADRVNIGEVINLQGSYFTFRWQGQSSGTSPVFEGFYFEKVTDKGLVKL